MRAPEFEHCEQPNTRHHHGDYHEYAETPEPPDAEVFDVCVHVHAYSRERGWGGNTLSLCYECDVKLGPTGDSISASACNHRIENQKCNED